MGKRPIRRLGPPRSVDLMLILALLLASAALSAPASAAPTSGHDSESPTLARARIIRSELNARYRLVRSPALRVTEASTTGIFDSLTLLTDFSEAPRVVPAGNGVYFAICTAGARCPYPRRSASLPATAFLPRRLAIELALRTFRETSATLVVVALPTARPTWVVLERDALLASDVAAEPALLARHPALSDAVVRQLVDAFTREHLFVPLPILPPTHETIYAASLGMLEP